MQKSKAAMQNLVAEASTAYLRKLKHQHLTANKFYAHFCLQIANTITFL